MTTHAYFPGCSLRGTGRAYDESLVEVFRVLGVAIEELDDWNCCGATTYMSYDEIQSYALAARNLALARKKNQDIVAPCAACYLVLNKTQHYVDEYPNVRQIVAKALDAIGMTYPEGVKVRHPLEILINDVGTEAIKAKVVHPLNGLRVAPYYGCQIVRPYSTFDDQQRPTTMDRLLETCGAKAVYYPVKTRCCGGSQKGTLPEIGLDLIKNLIQVANANGAEAIATVCPLCQFNLEVFQEEAARNGHKFDPIPVLYFTQLMGIALGVPARKLGLQRSFVPLDAVLGRKEAAHV